MKNVPGSMDVTWLFVRTSVVSEVRPLNAVAEIDVILLVEMSLDGINKAVISTVRSHHRTV